jgi:acetylglutamate kinase
MDSAVGPIVVKLGGAALDAPSERAALWAALRTLHAAHAGGLVLVHGGGQAVDRRLAQLGMSSERIEGLRVTPDEQIDAVVSVLAGTVNKSLVGAINRDGSSGSDMASVAIGLCLGDGGLATVERMTHPAGDLGRVGVVTGGSPTAVRSLLLAGFLPVIASIGIDAAGDPLNVNADDAAAGVASIVKASQLVLLTDVDGIRDHNGRVIEQIDEEQIERLIGEGVIDGGMIPKARGAVLAARTSGVAAVIASWKHPHLLATLASSASIGTRVVTTHAAINTNDDACARHEAAPHQTTEISS